MKRIQLLNIINVILLISLIIVKAYEVEIVGVESIYFFGIFFIAWRKEIIINKLNIKPWNKMNRYSLLFFMFLTVILFFLQLYKVININL